MVFVDASSLDRFNTAVRIISTSTPTSGIPLGVIMTSDDEESSIRRGLELLGDVFPVGAFNGRGITNGPSIAMTDDSSAEREALKVCGPICFCFCVRSIFFKPYGPGCMMALIALERKTEAR